MDDTSFRSGLNAYEQGNMNLFMQSLLNKDIQTQDVLITSFNYNFLYNEIGKADFKHPFYFNAKVELAGNTLSLLHNVFKNRKVEAGIIENKTARLTLNQNALGVAQGQLCVMYDGDKVIASGFIKG